MADPQQIIQSQTTIPDYAKPYVERMLGKAEAISGTNLGLYPSERIAAFDPLQLQAYRQAAAMQMPYESQFAPSMMMQYAQRAAQTGYNPQSYGSSFASPAAYNPTNFNYQSVAADRVNAPSLRDLSMQAAPSVYAQQVGTPQMSAAQTGYSPSLQAYQMGPAERVQTESFTAPGTAQSYMSPYQQAVTDIGKREAQRQADIAGTQRAARAVQSGAFGGSRQAIENAEAQRNLATQMADIQSKGSQEAYNQAAQMFTSDQARQLAAQQANQQSGLTTGQQNLASQLSTQQLGTQTGLQTSLANLTNQQQAAVQNQAAQLQAQGLNAQQALQAALANQGVQQQANLQNLSAGLQTQGLGAQTGLTAQQLNQASGLQAALANQQMGYNTQQAGEAARQFGYGQQMQAAGLGAQYGLAANQLNAQQQQFGAGLGLQGLQAGMQGLGQYGTLTNNLQQQQQNLANLQNAYGTQAQQQQQNIYSQQYQDFLNQQNQPYRNVGFMSDILRGVPLSQQTQATYQAPPSFMSQVAGLGVAGLGLANLGKTASSIFGKEGGHVKTKKVPNKIQGLPAIAVSKIGKD